MADSPHITGYNDDAENLEALGTAFQNIEPDRIQLNTLDRPGVVEGLKPLSREKLREITELLDLPGTEIITPAPKRKNITSYRKDAENIILETISRRPCTVEDLSGILGLHINEINKYLDVLDAEDKIKTTREERGIFYQKNDL